MLRDYIRLNQSMLAAFAVSITASAAVAQAFSDQAAHLNTTYTTIMDYVIYLSVFGLLFYLSNRDRYRSPYPGVGRASLRRDLKKLVASLGAGEVVYGLVRWLLQYYLLTTGQYDTYMTSVISQAVSIVVYLVFINLSVMMTRLYGER